MRKKSEVLSLEAKQRTSSMSKRTKVQTITNNNRVFATELQSYTLNMLGSLFLNVFTNFNGTSERDFVDLNAE
jgi:hypothetical protein